MASKTITKMQDETRRKQHFSETEASFKDQRTRKAAPTSTLQALFSRLGPLNPVSSPVRSDDIVWLFDNTAYIPQPGAAGAAAVAKIMPDKAPAPLARIGRAVGPKLETSLGSWGYFPPTTQKGQENWAAEFTFAVFEKEAHCSIVDAVSDIAHKIGLADDCQDKARIEERLTPFLLDVRPARKMVVEHAGRELRLGPTGSSGVATNAHGVAEASIRDKDHGGLASGRGVVPRGVEGILTMKTYYSRPEGWGVISDVDDTIKITQTSDPIGILRSTFVEPATPITGTPELYAHLLSTLRAASPNPAEHVPFFYLSASPYNLYPFLRQFVTDAAFPPGQLMLRDSSWKTLAGLLSALTVGTEAYKVGQMRRVRAWFPRRKMIFIGDSTQSDPEAYGHVYREYPGWIKLILIRRATDIAAVGIEAKNAPERFEEAFKGVPRSAWHVFDDPAECVAKIDEVVRAH